MNKLGVNDSGLRLNQVVHLDRSPSLRLNTAPGNGREQGVDQLSGRFGNVDPHRRAVLLQSRRTVDRITKYIIDVFVDPHDPTHDFAGVDADANVP